MLTGGSDILAMDKHGENLLRSWEESSAEKYLAWYFKMYVEEGAETLNYIGFVMNIMLWNSLKFLDLDELDMWWGWNKVILQRKSCVLNQEEMEIEE